MRGAANDAGDKEDERESEAAAASRTQPRTRAYLLETQGVAYELGECNHENRAHEQERYHTLRVA